LPLQTAAVDGGQSVDLIGALAALAEAMAQKTEIRGVRSAQRLLQERFGFNLAELARTGAFSSKKTPSFSARLFQSNEGTVLLVPDMWQERMMSERVRKAVGADELRLSQADAARLGVRHLEAVRIKVGGREREAVAHIADVTVPTLPALAGDLAGMRTSVQIMALAGGDD
jgi:hypothetical protein